MWDFVEKRNKLSARKSRALRKRNIEMFLKYFQGRPDFTHLCIVIRVKWMRRKLTIRDDNKQAILF